MHDCYKSVVNEMVVNACDVPVYEVVVKLQHTELGVLIDKEAYVEGQVVGQACLAGRHFVGVVGDDVELTEPLVVDQQRRPDVGTIPNIAMAIDVSDGFAVRRVAEQLHRISDYCLVGIAVSFASGRGYRFSEMSEARLPMVLDDRHNR